MKIFVKLALLLAVLAASACSSPVKQTIEPPEKRPDGPIIDPVEQDKTIRKLIRERVGHDPLLPHIFACETAGDPYAKIRHWEPDGTLVKNPHSSASGYGQLLFGLHGPWISRAGLDVKNDIEEYSDALSMLYRMQGRDAWNESKPCWGKAQPAPPKPAETEPPSLQDEGLLS